MPLQSHPDLVDGLVVESLGLVAEKMEQYTSAIDLVSPNTASNNYAGQDHKTLDLESPCCQKAGQFMV